MNNILIVPAYASGRGGGHLVRSAALVRELRGLGRDARLFLPSEDFRGTDVSSLIGDLSSDCVITGGGDLRRSWDCLVLDRFKTSRKELSRWASHGLLIGIDEGGPARNGFDFLLDILPGLPGRSPANQALPVLLPLPKTRREKPVSFDPPPSSLKVLVSFGAEDPADLTLPVCRVLAEADGEPALAVTAVLGTPPAHGETAGMAGIRFEAAVPDLKEKISSYDLVITHFGLTAFEALHAGTAVLLLSPAKYHEKLARHAGFVSAGVRRGGVRRLRRYVRLFRQSGKATPCGAGSERAGKPLNRPELAALAARSSAAAKKYGLDKGPSGSLGGLLADFSPRFSPVCPACGEERRQDHPVLARFPERTYRRCPRCGMVYMLRLTRPPVEYTEDYFFELYRRQYGRTYLEDFPNLKQAGKIRLHRIRRLLPPPAINKSGNGRPRLLDIGCAYGPFLAAAAEGGFSPLGIDPAEEAVGYVRNQLKIPGITGFFPDPSRRELRDGGLFDALTFWYVIEHFEDLAGVLRETGRLLKAGGVLAFSTPSIFGVSGRKSLKSFLEKSPEDHFTLWDPRGVRKILGYYGFTVKKIVITGHHPERFPLIGKFLREKRGLTYRIVDGISRFFGLGDTFETYAVKK